MRLAANNYKEDTNIKTDVIEKTLKYFLDMQGDYEGSRDITVGDKSQKCKVYSVVFINILMIVLELMNLICRGFMIHSANICLT